MIRNRWLALGLTTAVAVVLVACSGDGGATTPASTVEPAASLAAATDVVGHNTCRLTATASSPTDVGGLDCTQVASDARLTGHVTSTFRYADLPQGSNLMWGDSTLTNDGGTWTCEWVGLRSPKSYHALDMQCRGEKGYAGLWAYYHQDGDVGYSAFTGWIEYRG